MAGQGEGGGGVRKRRPLRLVPLLLVLGLGTWLWRGGLGLLPVERSVVFPLPRGDVSRVDVQLYDGDALLARSEIVQPVAEPSLKLSLKAGEYRAIEILYRADGGSEARERKLVADDDSAQLIVP